MTVYDITILAVIGIFAVWGLWRGIIRGAFDAAGIIIGVLAARQFAPSLGASLPPNAVPQIVRTIIASIIIMVVIWLVAKILCVIVRKIIRHGPVKSADRFGGFLIGALMGILLLLAIATLASFTPLDRTLSDIEKSSPVLRWTMAVARPLGNKYRKALGQKVKAQVQKAVTVSTSNAPTKKIPVDQVARTAEELNIANLGDINSVSIDLDKISPDTELLLKQLFKGHAIEGMDLAEHYDMLKSAGVKNVDISLEDLEPEHRQAIAAVVQGGDLKSLDVEKLTRDMNIDVDQITRQLGEQIATQNSSK